MRELMNQLSALRNAKNAAEFIKKEKDAYKALVTLEKNLKDKILNARDAIKTEYRNAAIKRRTAKLSANKPAVLTTNNEDLIAEIPETEIVQTVEADAHMVEPTEKGVKIEAIRRVRLALRAELAEFKTFAYDYTDANENEHIDWIDSIPDLLLNGEPEKRKKAKKALLNLIRITSQRNALTWETVEDLKRQVSLTKSYDALKALQGGEVIPGFKFPTLAERYRAAKNKRPATEDTATSVLTDLDFNKHVEEKSAYLNRKRVADWVAKGVNFLVSVLGVGLVGALACVTLLPMLGLTLAFPAALGVVAALTLLGGYTEAFVYYEYVQKFFRTAFTGFWGFFEGIDNKVLNRESYKFENFRARDRHALTPIQIQRIKDAFVVELTIKKALVALSFVIAIAAGVGYMGLLFTEVLSFLPAALLVSMPALVAVPWVLAAIVAPAYAIVMAGMLYKAIKDNYLLKMWEHCIDLFSYNKAPGGRSKAAHIALCVLKALGLAVVIGFSVVAIFATAGLWLQNSISFFSSALNIVDKVATGIGMAIWGIYVVTMLWFCAEKSLFTLDSLTKIKWENLKEAGQHAFSSPKKFFSFLCDAVLMVLHIGLNCSVAALGAEAKVEKKLIPDLESFIPGEVSPRATGAIADLGSEGFIDGGDALGLNHHHHHSSYAKYGLGKLYTTEKKKKDEHHGGHSHSHIVELVEKAVKGVRRLSTPKIEPKRIEEFSIRASSSV